MHRQCRKDALADLRFVVSLTNDDNDYQIEQAAAAQAAARRAGVNLEILYANNDAIEQSQQILKVV
jgi:ABC-type sugar transport system substrate-binding protein